MPGNAPIDAVGGKPPWADVDEIEEGQTYERTKTNPVYDENGDTVRYEEQTFPAKVEKIARTTAEDGTEDGYVTVYRSGGDA